MTRQFLSMYRPLYPKVLVYMLQNTEYQGGPYVVWLNRTKDFSSVIKRRTLDMTGPARMLLLYIQVGILAQIIISLALVYMGLKDVLTGGVAYGLALFLSYPFVWAYALILPLAAGNSFIIKPKNRKLVEASRAVFDDSLSFFLVSYIPSRIGR